MENSNSKHTNKELSPERAKAWIFTLSLGIVVCLGLIIYTSITHNLAVSWDLSLYKPELAWLGFVGFNFFVLSYLLFWIGSSFVKYLPDENERFISTSVILGIFALLSAFTSLFISCDLKNQLLRFVGEILQMTGASMVFIDELIQDKLNQIGKIWKVIIILLMFTGSILIACSLES